MSLIRDESVGSRPPDPGSARTAADLVRLLRLRKVWCGDPSYEELSRRTGVARSTLADALSRRRTTLPSLELVLATVRACGAGVTEQDRWRQAWRTLQAGSRADLPAPTAPAAEPARPVPAQLPPDVPAFVGREDVLLELDLLADPTGTVPVVVALTGAAGVGKTALAVRWGHTDPARWPDGQLFVRLRGHDPAARPVPPAEALDGMLRALDVPGDRIPADTEQRAALCRSALAGRRMLLVLDDATSSEQVRLLLPGSPGCFTVVSSRRRLDGLVARDGARPLALDALTRAAAVELTARLLGPDRVRAELAAATRLVELCDRLPLALRIAAARVAAADRPLRVEVEDLAGEQTGLSALSVEDGDTAVRAALALSYRALPRPAAETFRLLGVALGDEVTVPAAAALTGRTRAQVAPLLESLEAAHLVHRPAPGRYRMHDLVRLYAREQATGASAGAAVDRLLDWYAHAAYLGNRVLNPLRTVAVRAPDPVPAEPAEHADDAAALAWFDTERDTLAAALQTAAATGRDAVVFHLADGQLSAFQRRHRMGDWIAAYRLAVEPARRLPAQRVPPGEQPRRGPA